MARSTLNLNGVDLAFDETGQGSAMLLIHGSAADLRTWDRVTVGLADRHRVISYSRRYHWPNQAITPGADYSMSEHVEDLVALMGALELERVTLVGHSYGGFIALMAAMTAPDLVSRLILIEPPVIPLFIDDPPRPSQLLRLIVSNPAAAISLVRFGVAAVNPSRKAAERGDLERAVRIFGSAVLGRGHFEALSDARWQQILANYTLAEFTGSGFPALDPAALSKLRAPTLLVNGTDSPRLFHHLNDRLESLMPESERTEIPGASHMVQEDSPAELTEAVLGFVSRTPG
jgi:pimeloyl-ACP methyl ester carboxylesterase